MISYNHTSRPVVVLFTLLLAVGSLLAATPAEAGHARIHWKPCYAEFGPGFECGVLRVPLDHQRPHGRRITLALLRLPASDPSQRIGSLVFIPGGPGNSGINFILQAGNELYSPEVRARFDLIGFDSRGSGRSEPLRCFRTEEEAMAASFTGVAFPSTPEEAAEWEAADRRLAEACERRGGPIIDHMSTADIASDLDLIRQAVGDAQLSYVGYSYGSYLGITYANLFPDKVRALVVDGVVEPVAYATGSGEDPLLPVFTRLGTDQAARDTLEEFFRLCDAGGASCAFAGGASERYAALATRLRAGPIYLSDPEGNLFPLNYSELIYYTEGYLSDVTAWPELAEVLAMLEAAADVQPPEAQREGITGQAARTRPGSFPKYDNFIERLPGTQCADIDAPHSYNAYATAAADAERQYDYFGPRNAWASSICAVWPGPSAGRYTGPWNARTANPVLIVGNQYDPATRYANAVTLAHMLPSAALLTVAGWGHTSVGLSACADSAVSEYLLRGALPGPDAVCEPDAVPFAADSQSAMSGQAHDPGFSGTFIPARVRDAARGDPAYPR